MNIMKKFFKKCDVNLSSISSKDTFSNIISFAEDVVEEFEIGKKYKGIESKAEHPLIDVICYLLRW